MEFPPVVDAAVTSALDERRTRIANLAADLFDKQGYHRTSMAQIAEASQLAKPTIYHYFSGKEEILYEIHLVFMDSLISRFEERVPNYLPARLLESALADILSLMHTHRGHVRTFFEHHRELSAQRQSDMKALRDRYSCLVVGAFKAAVADGSFRMIDAELASLAFFGIGNWAYQWYQEGGRYSPDELAGILWDFFLLGVRQ